MATPPSPPQNDGSPDRPQDSSIDEIALRASRVAAAQRATVGSDQNARPPAVQYDNQGHRFFDTAPIPLKRLFGSPLVQTGKYAKGPNSERLVGDGWGAPRNFSYDPHINTNSRHLGLDFFAPKGEPLYACGDGVVTFVGYQSRDGRVDVPGAHSDTQNNVLDANGNVVASVNQLGFGGIAVLIKHNGDFQNYQTEYFHMSAVTVKAGQKVTEGQQIGNVGNTGLAGIGPHLHFQVSYVAGGTRSIVNPTAMVPNYRPGHADSTNSFGPGGIIMPTSAPNGVQIAAGQTANTMSGIDRATTMQNQTPADIKQAQANYADHARQVISVQQSQLYANASAFNGQAPVVSAPMTFDFAAGTWSDGKVT